MQKQMCIATIKSEYNRLTVKERQVADYILANIESIVTMSIGELSQRADVVKSVVIRFCQALGFSGYSEFKLLLAKELARNEQFNFSPYITSNDKNSDILDKIFAANIKTLHDTAIGIDRKILNDVISLLENAHSIYIYGIGTSAGIATDFQYRLMQLGYTAFCFTDTSNMKVSTLNIRPDDVVIGISNSGRTIATVDTLHLAREKGARTVCLTSYPNSEIVKQSDYPIVIKTDEIQYPIEAISARIAHISVLDTIAISLSAKDYDTAVMRSAQTLDLINTVRY